MSDGINKFKWSDIKDDFHDDLLVGNGGSIALSKEFNYKSLYSFAVGEGLLDESMVQVFKAFYPNNPNFERMLYRLWQADYVTKKLGSTVEELHAAYLKVRKALFNSVTSIHPERGPLEIKLRNIANYIKGFNTVYSLNYDILLYWSMQVGNEGCKHRIKDGFIDYKFCNDEDKLRSPYGANNNSTLVLYPHGNFLLYRTQVNSLERKLASNTDSTLLDTIKRKMQKGVVPLVVSEGRSSDKWERIKDSDYLMAVYRDYLSKGDGTLAVFGWSFDKSDQHITNALSNYKKIAVSIHSQLKEYEQRKYIDKVLNVISKLKSQPEVIFFESSSDCCWSNS